MKENRRPQGRSCVSTNRDDLIKVWKAIPVLCTLFLSALVFVCCFSVKETISSLPLIVRYLTEGKSFFFPFLPAMSLRGFLPDDAQVIPLTIGQLLDFIIFVNLVTVGNPIAIPFYRKVCQEYQHGQFYDLHIGGPRARQSSTWCLIDATPTILLNNHCTLADIQDAREGRDRYKVRIHGHRVSFAVARGEHRINTTTLPKVVSLGSTRHVLASREKISTSFLIHDLASGNGFERIMWVAIPHRNNHFSAFFSINIFFFHGVSIMACTKDIQFNPRMPAKWNHVDAITRDRGFQCSNVHGPWLYHEPATARAGGKLVSSTKHDRGTMMDCGRSRDPSKSSRGTIASDPFLPRTTCKWKTDKQTC